MHIYLGITDVLKRRLLNSEQCLVNGQFTATHCFQHFSDLTVHTCTSSLSRHKLPYEKYIFSACLLSSRLQIEQHCRIVLLQFLYDLLSIADDFLYLVGLYLQPGRISHPAHSEIRQSER